MTKMVLKAPGRAEMLAKMMMRQPPTYRSAMRGTSFSMTQAMRFAPPRKMAAEMSATMMPTSTGETPKAVPKAAPMELDCTMLPMKPRARMMATEKKAARARPKDPVKAARI